MKNEPFPKLTDEERDAMFANVADDMAKLKEKPKEKPRPGDDDDDSSE